MALWLVWQMVMPGGVQAYDYVWDGGGGNQNWTTPDNWNLNSSYPQYSTDTATINTGTTVHLDDSLDLGNLTVGAGKTLTFDHLKDLNLYSATVTNNGYIRLEQTGDYTKLKANGAVTLSGSGYLILGADTGNQLDHATGGYFINQSGHTIQGGGTIASPITNYGTIKATGGAEMRVLGGSDITNYGSGILQAEGYNSRLTLRSTISGGIIQAGANAYVYLDGATFINNPAFSGAGTIAVLNSSSMEGNFTNNGYININDGETLYLKSNPTVYNNGTIKVNSSGSVTELQSHNASGANTVTLSGTGSVELSGNANSKLSQYNSNDVFVNDTNHTIKGGGTIAAPITNKGTIQADSGGAALQVADTFTNSGGTIKTVGSGIFDNAGSTTNIDSKFVMAGGTLRSTALRTYSSSLFSGYGTIERPLTINGGGSLTASGGTLSFATGASLANNGTIYLNGVNGALDNLAANPMTLSDSSGESVSMAGGTLKSSSGYTYYSQTLSGYGSITAPLGNTGTVTAQNGTLELHATVTGGTVNTGSGGTLALHGATLSGAALQGGAVTVTDDSAVNNGSASFASGANLTINSTKTLTFGGSATLNNLGAINLNGVLDNNTGAGMTLSSVTGGSVSLAGGELKSTADQTFSSQTLSGYGTINARFTNTGSLIADGGTLALANANLINNGTLTVNNAAIFNNVSGANVGLGGGSTVLAGGELRSTSGSFTNTSTITGYGTVSALLTNSGSITASNGTLRLTGVMSGSGNLAVLDDATLDMQQNVQARDFAMQEQAIWRVLASNSLNLTREFLFCQTEESRWEYNGQPGVGPGFLISGGGTSSLEIGSRNVGATSQGFDGNFHLTGLSLDGADTYLNLADAVNNGHRSSPEALYVDYLNVPVGTTLDLNNLWLYTYNPESHEIMAVSNGTHLFGDGLIIGAPVPLPSTLLLLGSSLLGLAGWRRFRQG